MGLPKDNRKVAENRSRLAEGKAYSNETELFPNGTLVITKPDTAQRK